MLAVRASYVAPRRGTESQRARPPRCEAAPPKLEGLRVGWGGFLKRRGTASFFVDRRGIRVSRKYGGTYLLYVGLLSWVAEK